MDYVFRSACIVLGVISHLERERELGAVRQLNYAAVSMSTVIWNIYWRHGDLRRLNLSTKEVVVMEPRIV
jgi:hypothetical protein